MTTPTPRKPWYRILYVQVIIAVVLGIVVRPQWRSLKRIGSGRLGWIFALSGPYYCGMRLP